jgi:riboflavin synthase
VPGPGVTPAALPSPVPHGYGKGRQMFTGIVEELGEVLALERSADAAVLVVLAPGVGQDVSVGASIAVDGVCLTMTGAEPAPDGRSLRFDVMAETLHRSTLGRLRPGDVVNLERAVRADGRLGGHIVQGHVDGVAVVAASQPGDGWERVRFDLPEDLARYVAQKGSVAVDGVSLTVTAVGRTWFEVGLIPETLRRTTLGQRPVGAPVNLEVDVLAKYTERLLDFAAVPAGMPLTREAAR